MTQNSQSADYPRAEIIFVCRVQCNNYVQYYGKIGGQIRVQNFLAGEWLEGQEGNTNCEGQYSSQFMIQNAVTKRKNRSTHSFITFVSG